jgi:ABC-2 type transport system permease protein
VPIFEQGYQHWQGRLAGHGWRWWAVARHGIRVQFQSRWVKLAVFSSLIPALALAAFLIVWGLIEQGSTIVQPLLRLLRDLPEELRQGPKDYRLMVWTLAFHIFLFVQTTAAMVMVLLVGPDLISKDLRFNALPLYLSRPLRRFDYFLGKFAVIAAYLGLVTFGPILLAYALGVAFSMDWQVLPDTLPILLGSLAYSALVAVSAGTLMLAISSLTRNSRYVGALWIGFWLLSGTVSGILEEQLRPEDEWPMVVAYTNNLNRLEAVLLNTEPAWQQVDKLQESAQAAARKAAVMGPMFGGNRPGGRPPRPPDPRAEAEMKARAARSNLFRPKWPWEWSAGLLAGVFVVSAGMLSWRVKSLDRLR